MTKLTNHRAIARQATSAVAYSAEPPAPGDPLLDFEPVPHKAPRRNSITPDLQREFIAHLAATGIVKSAAKNIGKSIEAIYKLRQRPGAEGFNAAWEEALQWGVLRLEDCALERALAQSAFDPMANGMLCWVIQHRRADWVDVRNLEPGHPVYDYIAREVLEGLGREPDTVCGD
ncbi:hypothetical protein [Erythrobacter rubeus]|uniref:Uncharacterized protein n=1 Tax=Erythrobacter rubeus TaxID=2760803 RepID=A0ABR8KTE8_9SPHN|nr:hypothetical protein [Erythrobacter rubeus]MBD2841411.1 hypothetical protein [Erythrobacter rubeus]